jgi:ComF family protein
MVAAATAYRGAAKDIIWKLKFGRARSGATEVAALIASRLGLRRQLGRLPAVIITHAPTATTRVRQRGYDQAQLIARCLARSCGVPYRPLLARYGHQKQIGASKAQRAAQLSGAFHAAPLQAARIRGAHIILVDDVVTTGATLEAAAKTLMDAGARRVDAVVFAQA